MSGIAALLIALVLLVVAIYSLLSYIRERRHSGLPSKKTNANCGIDIKGDSQKIPALICRDLIMIKNRLLMVYTPSGAYLRHSQWLSS